MNKRHLETFKNPLQTVRPLTVDPNRRVDRRTISNVNNNEQRPKTTGLDIRKKVTSEFHSSSTSTNFSFTSDEDYDTDLEDDTSQYRDHSCIGIYEHVCKREKSIPVGHYLRHYTDSELSLCFYGLGPKGVRTFIPSLTMNQHITKLNLASNGLGDEGAIYIAHILRDNTAIVSVDLSQNFIGIDGAREICDMFRDNITINHLKLEGNLLDDECARLFGELISGNGRLYTLNLSRNKFESISGTYFGPALAENTTMQCLDLSWNSISGKGAVALIKGIQKNVFLRTLNLEHNGLAGGECGRALFNALKENTTLLELDLSFNRLTTEPATFIGRGLAKNESLQKIYLTGNPLESTGCYAIIKPLIAKNAIPNKLELIDLTEIMVNRDFHELYEQVKDRRPDVNVLVGLRPSMFLMKNKPQRIVPTPMKRLQILLERRPQFDLKSFFILAAGGDSTLAARILDRNTLKQAIEEKLNARFSDEDTDSILEEISDCDSKKFVQLFTLKPSTTTNLSAWRYKS
ncbi:unnamed protein product [Adineta ricciae]|uniref:Uncharacterized protein n=1 Tax=Adineta ricciae TaxID=249248 RepID=A0A813PVE2_ADIRI|nr:unnamed protein product [Adineta ricciae]CAF1004484.1 unnamed protein product [Adineta ricciae]